MAGDEALGKMLSVAENELLTRVGPGTPMGALLRRYWHPIGAVAEMEDRWTKRVRLLGEDLVLFRDRSGRFGLMAEQCPHRRASLFYGIPTARRDSLPVSRLEVRRHGHVPRAAQRAGRAARSRTRRRPSAYPVEELGGLLWAYLGPIPAPLIPRLDGLVATGTIRIARRRGRELQLAADHGELGRHRAHRVAARQVLRVPATRRTASRSRSPSIISRSAFDEFEYGIVKRRVARGPHRRGRRLEDRPPAALPDHAGDRQRRAAVERVPLSDFACRSTTRTRSITGISAFVTPPGVERTAAAARRVFTLRRSDQGRRAASTSSTRFTRKTSWRGNRKGRSPIGRRENVELNRPRA